MIIKITVKVKNNESKIPVRLKSNFFIYSNVLFIEPTTGEIQQLAIKNEEHSQISDEQNLAKILATVEEDEKMLDKELIELKKRENMISQLKSNITKETYRRCEKRASQLKGIY